MRNQRIARQCRVFTLSKTAHCPDLVAALEEIGQPYKKTKTLTARQVRLIMHYLGDP